MEDTAERFGKKKKKKTASVFSFQGSRFKVSVQVMDEVAELRFAGKYLLKTVLLFKEKKWDDRCLMILE